MLITLHYVRLSSLIGAESSLISEACTFVSSTGDSMLYRFMKSLDYDSTFWKPLSARERVSHRSKKALFQVTQWVDMGRGISSVPRPEVIAAAVPICGGGDPDLAKNIVDIPVWAFHGAKDMNVP